VAQAGQKGKMDGRKDIIRLKMLAVGIETGYPLTLDQ
jgi:hypothetical protein